MSLDVTELHKIYNHDVHQKVSAFELSYHQVHHTWMIASLGIAINLNQDYDTCFKQMTRRFFTIYILYRSMFGIGNYGVSHGVLLKRDHHQS